MSDKNSHAYIRVLDGLSFTSNIILLGTAFISVDVIVLNCNLSADNGSETISQ